MHSALEYDPQGQGSGACPIATSDGDNHQGGRHVTNRGGGCGAPGGQLDDDCPRAAIAKIQDRMK
jgi:hypothetical protein